MTGRRVIHQVVTELKSQLRRLVPAPLLRWHRARAVAMQHREFAGMDLRRVFAELYRRNLWGGPAGEFYSGSGSDDIHTARYVEAVRRLISSETVSTVVDLGCGDFRVGRQLQGPGLRYIGVDIVPDLIARNQRAFGAPEREFLCLDITTDPLPAGDICLIRQVLQHLSNAEILRVLENCRAYPRLVVTEHGPPVEQLRAPNVDHPHGPSTRLLEGSGVFLEYPPFRCRIAEVLCQVTLPEDGSVLRTIVIEQR